MKTTISIILLVISNLLFGIASVEQSKQISSLMVQYQEIHDNFYKPDKDGYLHKLPCHAGEMAILNNRMKIGCYIPINK